MSDLPTDLRACNARMTPRNANTLMCAAADMIDSLRAELEQQHREGLAALDRVEHQRAMLGDPRDRVTV